ncbi:MAG: S24 family peptidase [Thiobacillaceae bacterium]|jgi:SOS-response transcriptional repressor LexA|nr:S24 family peptidase [Thiobacillaceae bacterium]
MSADQPQHRGKPVNIPIRQEVGGQAEPEASSCASGEPYALMVLGDSMAPEFEAGEIIVVEPEGLAKDGSYVIAYLAHVEKEDERYIFRQLVRHPDGWMLKPLNPIYENIPIESIESVVKGVVVQKKKPGRRRAMKSYV